MGWFGKKTSYRDLVIEASNHAMEINLKDIKAFDGFPVNNLEAVIAIFWMVECSLRGLPRQRREMAGSHLMDEFLAWLSDDYSPEQMSRLVIPAFRKRLDEYSSLFVIGIDEDPEAPILRTFKQVVENVFNEDEAHIARIVAAILLWWQPITAVGARIIELDKNGAVAW